MSFESECRDKAKALARHIEAVLKVGEANKMHYTDVMIHLESHGLSFKDYIFKDAIHFHVNDNVVHDWQGNYYLCDRSKGENPNGYWY